MERGVEEEGNGEQHVEYSSAKDHSPISMPNQIANPVTYKLVRVEGDGNFVPATDDEVMEVENMFEGEKVEAPLIVGSGHVECHVLDEDSVSIKGKMDASEGKLQGENTKVDVEMLNARLEYIGVMLQRVKQEEKLRISSVDHSSHCMVVDNRCPCQPDNLSAAAEKLHTDHSPREPPLPANGLKDSCTNQLGHGGKLKPSGTLEVGGSSASGTASASCSSSIPDFSRIKGEICLDNLSVRELQETFWATFGRETSVKDMLWLKRRIAMGLTNSCDVSTTTFIIKDNVLVGKEAKETHSVLENISNVNPFNDMVYDICKASPTSPSIQVGGQQVAFCKRMKKPLGEYECKADNVCIEQSATKRVRKPTKRYIEELSEAENREGSEWSMSSVHNSGNAQSSTKRIRHICDITDETALLTRRDSLGGCGIEVPYVSRVRRGRPRENFASIMQHYHPSGTGIEAGLANEDPGVCSREDSKSEGRDLQDKVAPKHIQQQVVAKTDQENLVKSPEKKLTVKIENPDSYGDDSDCNVTLPTSKDGVKRKHHRPWTLCEVIKLVEGVSKFGAGRWAEIKKVDFATFSYRTSVDLKDKWRNLLRASSSQGLSVRGVHEALPGSSFNSLLLNRYKTGSDYVAWHADDEKLYGPTPEIASISFGCEREFLLRKRLIKSSKVKVQASKCAEESPSKRLKISIEKDQHSFLLKHGSLLVMKGYTQRDWVHSVPKRARADTVRINLTFRRVLEA